MRAPLIIILFVLLVIVSPAKALDDKDDDNVGGTGWSVDCRRSRITKIFMRDERYPVGFGGFSIETDVHKDNPDLLHAIIERDEFKNLEKALAKAKRIFKKCDLFTKCLNDRDAGKVKHCYITIDDGDETLIRFVVSLCCPGE
jgi:hypothetical protein